MTGVALPKGAMREGRSVLGLLALVVLVGAAVLSTIQGIRNALVYSLDMQWSPARLLIHGHDPYNVWLQGNLGGKIILAQSPNYGHLLYLIMAPLGALPWHSARALWAVVNVCLGLGTAVMLCRRGAFGWRATIILTSIFATSTPFRNSVGNGQQSLLVFAAIALSVCTANQALAGCATAVSIVKYSFALPLLILHAFRRRVQTIVLALLLSAAGVVAFAAITDRFALETLWEPLRVNRNTLVPGTGDLMSFVNALRLPSAGGVGAEAAGLILAIALMLFSRSWTSEWSRDADLSLVGLVSLVSVYHLEYDFVLLFPVLLSGVTYRGTARWVLFAIVAWFFFGLRVVLALHGNMQSPRLILMNMLLLLCAYATLVLRSLRPMSMREPSRRIVDVGTSVSTSRTSGL